MELFLKELDRINKLTYTELGQLLYQFVPEYKIIYENSVEYEFDMLGNYLFMNSFAEQLSVEVDKDVNSAFVINAFKYINLLSKSRNLEILNILKVGILEILYSNKSIREKIIPLLDKDTFKMYIAFSEFYH